MEYFVRLEVGGPCELAMSRYFKLGYKWVLRQ
jgi:hypothetical protein